MYNVISDPTGEHLYRRWIPRPRSRYRGRYSFQLHLRRDHRIGDRFTGAYRLHLTGMAIDPTGVFLAIDNFDSGTISLFKIGADGSLSASPTPTVATGTGPEWVVFYTAADPSE